MKIKLYFSHCIFWIWQMHVWRSNGHITPYTMGEHNFLIRGFEFKELEINETKTKPILQMCYPSLKTWGSLMETSYTGFNIFFQTFTTLSKNKDLLIVNLLIKIHHHKISDVSEHDKTCAYGMNWMVFEPKNVSVKWDKKNVFTYFSLMIMTKIWSYHVVFFAVHLLIGFISISCFGFYSLTLLNRSLK